ncbi:MAG: DUF1295 domain-containing protein [Flavobacteriaceae bacterium]
MILKKILHRALGYLPFFLCIVLLFLYEEGRVFLVWNTSLQLLLFILIACIPAYFTKRMSYVDIAWPWGLVAIGILTLFLGKGYDLRIYIVSGMYLISGLRMGIGALILFKKGHLDTELSRYQFQRIRWKKIGYSWESASLQYEIMVQCLANSSFLSLPAILQFNNPQETLSIMEITGYLGWFLFIIIEHLADVQKQTFLIQSRRENKKRTVCNTGLWRYSRHPNYFAEWMIWNAMAFSSISSFSFHYNSQESFFWIALAFALIYVSRLMHKTLVHDTGVIPSEHYSLKKRPDYKTYQRQTPMFFPSFYRK